MPHFPPNHASTENNHRTTTGTVTTNPMITAGGDLAGDDGDVDDGDKVMTVPSEDNFTQKELANSCSKVLISSPTSPPESAGSLLCLKEGGKVESSTSNHQLLRDLRLEQLR